jgi:acetyl esterase/lipase
MTRRLLWAVAGSALLLAPAGNAQPPRPRPEVRPGLVFGKAGDVTLLLDLAMPAEGEGPFPAIVCVHGGGWVAGDRRQMAQTIEVLARRGYVAVAPDYRLAPAHTFPAQVEDCKCAVRWLRANAKKYRVDPDRIGVMGLAAGGHLACLLGVTGRADGLEGGGGHAEASSSVQAVVSFFGPTDLTQPAWDKEVVEKNLVPLLGGTYKEQPERYRKASPLLYPCRGAPPFLFLHGSEDRVVPLRHSEELAAKLREAGGSARVLPLEGEGHGLRSKNLLRAIDEMLTFFDETLKK